MSTKRLEALEKEFNRAVDGRVSPPSLRILLLVGFLMMAAFACGMVGGVRENVLLLVLCVICVIAIAGVRIWSNWR